MDSRHQVSPRWALPAAFSIADEKQEKAADEKTLTLLKRFFGDPLVEKAPRNLSMLKKIEEAFHKDFDGIDLS